ncbi:amidohydrolase [Eionea flava]
MNNKVSLNESPLRNLCVAVIQPDVMWLAPEKNLIHLANLMKLVPQNTHLIVLPEMFTSGFTQKPESVDSCGNDGNALQWMKRLAKHHDAAITGSVAYPIKNGNFVNRLLFVTPEGQVSYYDKRHLFAVAGEHKRYTAGTERRIIDYKGWRLLLSICYDLRFPVFCRNQQDYDAMICVANWPASRRHAWRTLLQARAIENQAYVIGSNRVGKDGNGLVYNGDSMLVDYQGHLLADGGDGHECILSSQWSMDHLELARQNFPVAQDADAFDLQL